MLRKQRGAGFPLSKVQLASGASVLALALAFTASAPQQAAATECLLTDGTVGGATSNGDTSIPALACGIGASATGFASTGVGGDATASGFRSSAFGSDAEATGDWSTALGALATASGQDSTALGMNAVASGFQSTVTGSAATASGDYSTATGFFASASGEGSVAMGLASTASGGGSVAMGLASTASGDGSIAIGGGLNGDDIFTTASGYGALAVGAESTASGGYSAALGVQAVALGDLSTATGAYASASGTDSTAMGDYASASFDGSTAIGTHATTTAVNEMMFGTPDNTYTAPGITSDLSRQRQSGPLELVTTDATGHLASDGGDVFKAIATLQAGTAVALALTPAQLADGENFGVSFGWGDHAGVATAFGISAIGVVGRNLFQGKNRLAVTGGLGMGYSQFLKYDANATMSGRASMQFTW